MALENLGASTEQVQVRALIIGLERGVKKLHEKKEALRSELEGPASAGMGTKERAEKEIQLEGIDAASEEVWNKLSDAEMATGAGVAMGRRAYGEEGPGLPMTGKDFDRIKDSLVRKKIKTLYQEADKIIKKMV